MSAVTYDPFAELEANTFERLAENGFEPVPIAPPGAPISSRAKAFSQEKTGKVPAKWWGDGWSGLTNWTQDDHAAADFKEWASWPGAGAGIRTAKTPAVDIDVTDEALASALEEAALRLLGQAPRRTGRAPKRLLSYRTVEPFGKRSITFERGKEKHVVEVLCDGQQFVAYGLHPSTQQPYRWERGNPLEMRREDLAEITASQVAAFFDECKLVAELMGFTVQIATATMRDGAVEQTPIAGTWTDSARERVIEYLRDEAPPAIDGQRGDDKTLGIARRAKDLGVPDPATMRELLAAFYNPRCVPPWSEDDLDRFSVSAFRNAQEAPGSKTPQAEFKSQALAPIAAAEALAPDVPSIPSSEDALALDFAESFEGDLRFVAKWGAWLRFDGRYWRHDDTLSVFDDVRRMLREHVQSRDRSRADVRKLLDRRTIAAVEAMARSDRRLAATADQWDADPWTLNTPAGIVDLRTGALRMQCPEDYVTKITAVAPGGHCPLWHKFLDRVTAGRKDLQIFLQKMAGYALTGSTREHALFFLYGTGGNGKGVFLNTATGILGEYAKVASIETFTMSTGERHPTELAMLRGPRLVVAQETEEGRKWAEARLKAITGGDRIAARFMRGDFFEFTPQFKLVIAGNHKPGLRHVDEAMRRRLHLVPFDVTVPSAERDPDLSGKLQAEWPGILQWMIDGCLLWQQEGLQPPEIVRATTNEYFAAEDALAQWLEERCDTKTTASTASNTLYHDWKTWAVAAGEAPGTNRRFSENIEARGFRKEKTRDGRMFQKIALRGLDGEKGARDVFS